MLEVLVFKILVYMPTSIASNPGSNPTQSDVNRTSYIGADSGGVSVTEAS